MKTVDARGLSCPEPVVMTRKALLSKEDAYQVIVDSETCKENVTRFARSQGYNVKVTEKNGDLILDLTK